MLNCAIYDATPEMLLELPLEILLAYRDELRALIAAQESSEDNIARFLCGLNRESLKVVEEALGMLETLLARPSPRAATAQENPAGVALQELLGCMNIQPAQAADERHLLQGTIIPDTPVPADRSPTKK